jgi:Clp amino terminal domain, pathogenicity island component
MSVDDAEHLGHHAIGTQHLLIGLLHEGEGAALHAMRALGAPPEEVWISAFRQLGVDAPPYVRARLPSVVRQRDARPLGDRIPTVAVAAGGASFVVGLFLGWLIWG